jgi:hypothetical protein
MTILREGYHIAKKSFSCDAREHIVESGFGGICKGIKSGDRYFTQVHIYDGDFMQFKRCIACKEFAKLNDTSMESL